MSFCTGSTCNLIKFEEITLTRRAEGVYNEDTGYYEEGSLTTETINANVQPLTGKEIEQLAEADRTKQHKKIFTEYAIQDNDIIIYKNIKYEVQSVEDWSSYCTNHYSAIARMLDNQNESV